MKRRLVLCKAALAAAVVGSMLVALAPPAAAVDTPRFVAVTGSDTVPVNNQCTNSAQPCRTIARAHTVAVGGDTINVAAGTYAERLTITKGGAIKGAGAGSTIIDGFSTATAGAATMTVNLAAGQPTLTISGVTVTRGFSNFGAGLGVFTGTVVVNDSTITNNNTLNGTGGAGLGVLGTVFGTTQNVTLNRVTISNNTATNGAGGGIWSAGPLTMTDTTITGNRATGATVTTGLGGGLAIVKAVVGDTPSVSALRATVSSNAANSGGGMYATGQATFTDSTFASNTGNAATGVGGGIYLLKPAATDVGTAAISNTAFSQNSAALGGGIGVNTGGQLTVTNGSAFTQNSAPAANLGGGGIWSGGKTTVAGGTFTSNTADAAAGIGGAIYASKGGAAATDGVLTLTGPVTLTQNSASFGGGIAGAVGTVVSVTGATFDRNTSGAANRGGGGMWVGATATVTDSTFSANTANASSGIGGGIYALRSAVADAAPNLTIDHTAFSLNTAALGGGIAANSQAFAAGTPATAAVLTVRNNSGFDQNQALVGSGVFGGGGIWSAGNSTVNGGTFTSNKANAASGIGGAIYVSKAASPGGSLIVSGTAFSLNSGALGGAIGALTGTVTTATGATFDQNSSSAASLGGGGIWSQGKTTITDGSFTNNTANATNGLGGGVYVTKAGSLVDDGKLTILGTTTFSKNAAGIGGGVAMNSNTLLAATGTSFDQNSAVSGGGLYEAAVGTLTNTAFTANTASFAGGAVYDGSTVAADRPNLTAVDSTFTGNTSSFATGGVAVIGNATLTTTGGAFRNNIAPSAGALSVNETGVAILTRTDLTGNQATGGFGGAILNAGSLTVNEASISNNSAAPVTGQTNTTGFGGAIYSGSNASGSPVVRLSLNRVLMSGNAANAASAIDAATPTQTSLRDSTVTGNTSGPGAGSIVAAGPMSLVGDTINANTSPAGTNSFGGVYSFGATSAAGTIIYSNSGGNCFGAPTDGGYNLTNPGDTGCGFTAPTSIHADPQLNALANNGGPTFTEAPNPSSPVINVIPTGTVVFNDAVSGAPITLCPGVDQRTITRPQGARCDIGAMEIGNTAPTLTGPDGALFIIGTPNSVGFSSTGVPTPDLSSSGGLPAGVTFTDNGDGTATLAGNAGAGTANTYPLTITAANGTAPDATKAFTLTVIDRLAITTTTLPHGVVGDPYPSTQLTATGGTPPYTWTVTSGTLLAGLSLAADGTITGTPTGPPGSSTFDVTVKDSTVPQQSATKSLTIVIDSHATIAGPASATWVTGTPNSAGFTSTGSPTPVVSASGAMPSGVTFTPGPVGSGTGTISGTPAPGSHGVYPVTVRATNGVGAPAEMTFTLTVIEPVTVTTTSLPDGTVGTAYPATQLTATGGTPPYTWSLASGTLPAGLTMSSSGLITGTPTGPRGTSSFTVRATDSTTAIPNLTGTKALSILIHATPTQLVADPALIKIVFPQTFITAQNVKAHLTAGVAHAPVVGATLQFSVSGTVYCTAVTDGTGTAQCPGLNVPFALAMVLGNGFDVTYAGSPTLEPATAHGPLIFVS